MELQQIKPCQQKQLEALKYLDNICSENGLTYYAHTGTLLGAARHGGYIPWDMDTDIIMPAEDCQKLLDILDEQNHPYFKAKRAESGSLSSNRMIAKTALCYGTDAIEDIDKFLHIDIYSLTWAKKRCKKLDTFYNIKARLFGRFIFFRHGRKGIAKRSHRIMIRLIKLFYGHCSDAQLSQKIIKRAVSKKETAELTVPDSFYGYAKETYPKEWFAEKVLLPFEDMKIPAPIGYEKVLTTLYGDWRSLPPEDKRYPKYLAKLTFEIVDGK